MMAPMFPTPLFPSPILRTLFQISLKGEQICLAWAYLLLFLTGNQNPGLSREQGKRHKNHPALSQIGNGATKSESLCALRQLKCKSRGWRDGSKKNQLLMQRI